MPQFDILQYSTQLFWLMVIFNVFYFYGTLEILPRLATVYKTRNKKLNFEVNNSLSSKKELDYSVTAGKQNIFESYNADYQNLFKKQF